MIEGDADVKAAHAVERESRRYNHPRARRRTPANNLKWNMRFAAKFTISQRIAQRETAPVDNFVEKCQVD